MRTMFRLQPHNRRESLMGTRLRRAGLLFVVLAALALPIQALAGEQVPFKGSDSGTAKEGTHACSASFAPLELTGSGVATHVGRYRYHAHECLNFATLTFSGVFTITAANGDKISGTYAGTAAVVGSSILYEQHNVVTDGTGRFAGASGRLHANGVVNPATLEWSEESSGTVSSPGAAKK